MLSDMDKAALDMVQRIIHKEREGMIIIAMKKDGDIDLLHTISGLTNAEVVICLNEIITSDEQN